MQTLEKKNERDIKRNNSKIVKLEVMQKKTAPKPVCGECSRTLETEDELKDGYCLNHSGKSWRWASLSCPQYRDYINEITCAHRRKYSAAGMDCDACCHNPNRKHLSAAKGIVTGVLISATVYGGLFYLYNYLISLR